MSDQKLENSSNYVNTSFLTRIITNYYIKKKEKLGTKKEKKEETVGRKQNKKRKKGEGRKSIYQTTNLHTHV